METVVGRSKLGTSAIEVSRLVCGTWGLATESYGAIFPEQRRRTIERALVRGINTFDMAPVWGDDGASERAVAEAVAERRAECTYITRAGQRVDDGGFAPDFSPAALESSCDASLRRLATDHVDVWLLHNADEASLRDDAVLRTAEKLVTSGKVRAWGASVNDIDAARAALTAGAQVLCIPRHVFSTGLFDDIADDCAARGTGLLVRSPLFHGLLSAAYAPGRRFSASDHRAARFSPEGLQERLLQIARMRSLVKPPLRTCAGLALAYALTPPAVSAAIFGPRTPSHIDTAADAAVDPPALDDATLRALRELPR